MTSQERVAVLFFIAVAAPACSPIPPPKLTAPPAAPTGLAATVSTARVDLTWTDNATNEAGFKIERSDDGGTTWVQVGAAPKNATAFSDGGLLPGTSYLYRVCAWNSRGPSSFAGPVLSLTDGLAWSPGPMTDGPPSARVNHSAVYDSQGKRMLVFGGIDDFLNVYNELWAFDLSNASIPPPTPAPPTPLWSQPAPLAPPAGIVPPLRMGHAAVFDPVHNRMVVFGGLDELFVFRNEVFVLDLTTMGWSQPAVTGTPPAARGYHTAVYDDPNQQMIIYGGSDGTFELKDVAALSLSDATPFAWSVPAAWPPPLGREQHAAAFDSAQGRMVVFGGLDNNINPDGSVLNADTWYLTTTGTSAWIPGTFASGPGFRMGQTGVYDSANRQMLIFGGDTTTFANLTTELWRLSLTPPESWTLLTPAGIGPAARYAHTAVYDSVFHRMILYGGWDGLVNSYNDVWILKL